MSAATEPSAELLTLTAFAVGQEHLQLYPAPSKRQWMEETHQHFANRCLPMLMANQSGWFLVSKVDISAVWNGGQAKEALTVTGTSEFAGHLPAVSIFGHGILTWHIPYLFRTPRDFNLLVRGPANWPRENAFALEGLVETDWAVATFTMNYKILQPNVPVHFRAGEPVCMIVPQRRGELESFHPFIRSIDDNSSESQGYRRWSASRAEFLQSLTQRSRTPAEGAVWQKHYFRGTSPDGTSGNVHETRRSLAEFEAQTVGISARTLSNSAEWAPGIDLSYVVCTSPRCGSTLLTEALAGTRVAGQPDEFFDVHEDLEAMIRKRFDAENAAIEEYLTRILREAKTPNGVFGWKAHWHQFEHFWRRLLGVPLDDPIVSRGVFARVFPNLRYIWLRRRDRLRQAVSYTRAIQTDVWRSYVDRPDQPKAAVAFDKASVDKRLDEIDRMEASWERFFQRNGIEPYVVWYEDFVADYQNTLHGVLRHLEVRLPPGFAFPPPRLQKQADEGTERWIEQYRGS